MITRDFIKKLNSDTALAQKLAAAGNQDKAYDIARAEGVSDDKDTFCKTMEAFRKEIHAVSPEEKELLVGSASTSEIVSAVSTCVGAAASAASAAV